MLSRVAENFYWMGRYLERVYNTASLLDVTMGLVLESNSEEQKTQLLKSLIEVTQGMTFFNTQQERLDEVTVHDFLLFSPKNPSSVINGLIYVRETMRSVRPFVSDMLWLVVNEFYLSVKKRKIKDILHYERSRFYEEIRKFSLLFYGAADHTLPRNQAWNFLNLGQALERALETMAHLELHWRFIMTPKEPSKKTSQEKIKSPSPEDYRQWQILLRSVDALETYVTIYNSHLSAQNILELLLLSPQFPRSVLFNLEAIQRIIREDKHHPKSGSFWGLEQKVVGLLSDLKTTRVDDLFHNTFETLPLYLKTVHDQLKSFNAKIQRSYFGSTQTQEQESSTAQ